MFHSLSLLCLAALVATHDIKRREPGAPVKPADQSCVRRQFVSQRLGLARKVDEDALGNIAGEVRRIHLPERSRVNEVRVTRHNLAKCRLRPLPGVSLKKLRIRNVLHLTNKQPLRRNPTVFFQFPPICQRRWSGTPASRHLATVKVGCSPASEAARFSALPEGVWHRLVAVRVKCPRP